MLYNYTATIYRRLLLLSLQKLRVASVKLCNATKRIEELALAKNRTNFDFYFNIRCCYCRWCFSFPVWNILYLLFSFSQYLVFVLGYRDKSVLSTPATYILAAISFLVHRYVLHYAHILGYASFQLQQTHIHTHWVTERQQNCWNIRVSYWINFPFFVSLFYCMLLCCSDAPAHVWLLNGANVRRLLCFIKKFSIHVEYNFSFLVLNIILFFFL